MTEQAVVQTEEQAEEQPVAIVLGQPVRQLPDNLYIPPRALEVFLEAFEGPLDLLLYLIKRHNLDILDIPIAEITKQYMQYVELMKDLHLELAAEYLVMAALLAEIKSRSLLPRTESEEEDEDDPRAELVRRLQEYERFKKAAEDLDNLPRFDRDVFPVGIEPPEYKGERPEPKVEMQSLLGALKDVMQRAKLYAHHQVVQEPLTIRERMTEILERLPNIEGFVEFTSLFDPKEGRVGVVVTLIAVLELLRNHMIDIVQSDPYGPIHVTAAKEQQAPVDNDYYGIMIDPVLELDAANDMVIMGYPTLITDIMDSTEDELEEVADYE